jgi:hypothetical protein
MHVLRKYRFRKQQELRKECKDVGVGTSCRDEELSQSDLDIRTLNDNLRLLWFNVTEKMDRLAEKQAIWESRLESMTDSERPNTTKERYPQFATDSEDEEWQLFSQAAPVQKQTSAQSPPIVSTTSGNPSRIPVRAATPRLASTAVAPSMPLRRSTRTTVKQLAF